MNSDGFVVSSAAGLSEGTVARGHTPAIMVREEEGQTLRDLASQLVVRQPM